MTTPAHTSLVEALERAAEARAPLFTFHLGAQREALDAVALRALARRWAGRLHAEGVGRGEPVPILLPTGADFVGAMLGAATLGAIPTPLATPMTFGAADRFLDHLDAVVDDCGATALVASPRLRDAIAERPLRERLRAVLVPGDEPSAITPPSPSIDGSDLALLQYTSGTTGRPKGVAISHRALVANAAAIAHGLGLGPRDVGVSWLPPFHDMGLVGAIVTCICHPYPVHLLPPSAFAMRPTSWLRTIAEVRGTVSAAPNFAYQHCLDRARRDDDDDRDLDLSSWRAALNGSEQVHPETLERFAARYEAFGFSPRAWRPVYGMAESTLAVTMPRPDEPVQIATVDRDALHVEGRAIAPVTHAHRLVSVGEAVQGMELRVRVGDADAPEGVVGEVELRGSSLMDGYYRNPEATAEVLRDGWLRTGDLGVSRGGQLYVVGRAKAVIVKAGRNVHPPDVERIACARPEIAAAAASGEADPSAGTERLLLRVETRERRDDARRALEARIRGDVLAALGVRVDEIAFFPIGRLPRTTSGKIRRVAP